MGLSQVFKRKKSFTLSLTEDDMHTPSEISSMTDRISKTQIEADDEADSIIIGIVSAIDF